MKNPAEAAGMEEPVAVAAAMIRTLDLTGRRISPQTPDEVVVEGFLRQLDEQAGRRLPQRVLSRLTASKRYLPGPYTRGELEGRAEEIEVLQGSLGDARRVLIHAGAQLGLSEEEALRELRWETVERFGRALYDARGKDGALLLKDVDSESLARWFYRDLPNRLVPHPWVAGHAIDRERLQQALANPFRLANEQGNQAAVEAMRKLLDEGRLGEEALTDVPESLQKTPNLVIPWVRLVLAFNLVDYSQPAILAQIEREQGQSHEEKLIRYVLGRTQTPFAWGERNFDDLARYVKHVIEASPRPGREHLLEVVLGDNNVQLAATLKLIEVKLSANPRLDVVLLLKGDNAVMNDASVADAEALLRAHPDFYRRLLEYRSESEGQRRRFSILRGPRSHGFPLDRVTRRIASLLQRADSVFVEGEANTWMVNQLRAPRYLAFRLKWPLGVRRIVGLQPEELEDHPPAFFSVGRTPYYENVLSRRKGNRPLTIEQAWARPHAVVFRVRPGERVEGVLPTGEKVTFSVGKGRVFIPEPARYVTFRHRSLQPGAVWRYTLLKTFRGILPSKRRGDEGYKRRVDEGVYFFPLTTIEGFLEGGRLPPEALESLRQQGIISEELKEAFLDGQIKVEELVNRAVRPTAVVDYLAKHRLPPRFLRVEAPYVFWELERHFRWDGSLDYVTVEMRYREPPAPTTRVPAPAGMEETGESSWDEWGVIVSTLRGFDRISDQLRLQGRIDRLIQNLKRRDTDPALAPHLFELYGIPIAIGAELERNSSQASARERLLELFGWANLLVQDPRFRSERSIGNRDEFLDLILRYGARSALQASQDREGLRENLRVLWRFSQAFLPMSPASTSRLEKALAYQGRFRPELQPTQPEEFAEQFGLLELAATPEPEIDWTPTAPDEFTELAKELGEFYRQERRYALADNEEPLPATAGVPSFAGMEERRATEELLVGSVEMAADDQRRITMPSKWRSYRTADAVVGELVEESERRFIRLLPARTGESDSVPLDPQHRIRLPESWLSWVGVQADGRVALLGVKEHLELWSPAAWQRLQAEGEAAYRQALEAALAEGPFGSAGMEEGIPQRQVLENLRAIREELVSINQQLEPEQRLQPEDLTEEMILRYGAAIAEFNAVMLNGELTAEDLEREFLNFHQILGHGAIHQAGEYAEERIGEARALFRHLLSESGRRGITEDLVGEATRTFVALVNLQGFHDGNKRTASLIMNWVLLRAGYTPFILSPENVVRYTQMVNPTREDEEDFEVSETEFREFLAEQVEPRTGMEEQWRAFIPGGIQLNPPWSTDPGYAEFQREPGLRLTPTSLIGFLGPYEDLLGAQGISLASPGGTGLILGFGRRPEELIQLAERYDLRAVHGVEWVDSEVEAAARFLESEGYSPDRFILHHNDLSRVEGIPDASIQIVVAKGLRQITDDRLAREVARVLTPGGIAIIDGEQGLGQLTPPLASYGEVLVQPDSTTLSPLVFRKASAAGMEQVQPLTPEQAVEILRSKGWPARQEQMDFRFLALRGLKPGQRSWHLGSALSPLPVLEALKGLKVRAEDSNEGMKGSFDMALSTRGLDSLIAESGGEVAYLHSDVARGEAPAPGSVNHIVAIDLFTGSKEWMDAEIDAVIRRIADAAAETSTVLISGEGFVQTAADGAARLEQELKERGRGFLKWDVQGLLPRDAADTQLWLFTISPGPQAARPGVGFVPADERSGLVGFLLEGDGVAFGPLFALAAVQGWSVPFAGMATRERIDQLAAELPPFAAELLRKRMVTSDEKTPEEARQRAEWLIQGQVPARQIPALVITPVREVWEELLAQIEGYLRLVGLKLAGPEDRNRALEILRAA